MNATDVKLQMYDYFESDDFKNKALVFKADEGYFNHDKPFIILIDCNTPKEKMQELISTPCIFLTIDLETLDILGDQFDATLWSKERCESIEANEFDYIRLIQCNRLGLLPYLKGVDSTK